MEREGALAGRRIIVTGGAGDIGRAMCAEFCERGAQTTIFDLAPPRPELLDPGTPFGRFWDAGAISFLKVDVTDRDSVRQGLDQAGHVDVVVGNAGISDSAPFLEITREQWDRQLTVNLTGNFYLGQEAAKRWIVNGDEGSIIFTGSWVQEIPWPEIAAYSVSKAGLQMLARSMALELARYGIRVNVLAPGIVAAGMAKHQMQTEPQYLRRIQGIIPLGRPETPEDVARAAAFLCSDDAKYMTGTTLVIDGGTSLFQFQE